MRIVIDTNVLISGAFFSGMPSRILDACLDGSFQIIVSPEIIEEYRRVGEEFSERRPNADFDGLLALLVSVAVVVTPLPISEGICRDPDDDKFIACAIDSGALVIVSGDKDLLAVSPDSGVEVLTPRGFVTRYMQSQGR